MIGRSPSRTLVNPRPEPVLLRLSDGTQRTVGPWGLAILPRTTPGGAPLEVVEAQILLTLRPTDAPA
jgi:hypothetical protein